LLFCNRSTAGSLKNERCYLRLFVWCFNGLRACPCLDSQDGGVLMQAIIYNQQREVIASHFLPSFLEACEWIDYYLGWNNLKRVQTKTEPKLIKVLTGDL
jgi:hypothetical protein